MAHTSYNKAIKICEVSNCRTSYVFVDFIYNHMLEADNLQLSFSSAYTTNQGW